MQSNPIPYIVGAVSLCVILFVLALGFQTGAGGLGLTLGFMAPFETPFTLTLLLAIAIWATMVGSRAAFVLPIAMLSMFITGVSWELPSASESVIRMIPLASVLLFGGMMFWVKSRAVILCSVAGAVVSYQYGISFAQTMPIEASPLFMVVGAMLAMLLMMAVAVCAGIAFFSDQAKLVEQLRASASFGSFF